MPFFKSKKNKNRRTDGTGFLTYAEVNDHLPEDIADQIKLKISSA